MPYIDRWSTFLEVSCFAICFIVSNHLMLILLRWLEGTPGCRRVPWGSVMKQGSRERRFRWLGSASEKKASRNQEPEKNKARQKEVGDLLLCNEFRSVSSV